MGNPLVRIPAVDVIPVAGRVARRAALIGVAAGVASVGLVVFFVLVAIAMKESGQPKDEITLRGVYFLAAAFVIGALALFFLLQWRHASNAVHKAMADPKSSWIMQGFKVAALGSHGAPLPECTFRINDQEYAALFKAAPRIELPPQMR